MKFNSEEFKKNIKFLLSIFFIVVILTVLSLVTSKKESLNTIELSDSLDMNITELVINEVCSSNDGVIIDSTGNSYDWIELYNGSSKDITLLNYGLSDKDNEVKWAFPDVTIKSDEYLVIFLSGAASELSANFSLSSSGGEVLSLRDPNGEVVDAFQTEKIKNNYSFIRDESGVWYKTNKPTPGFENSEEGFNLFQESLKSEENILRITEFLPVNKGNFLDENNLLSGYIEITNMSDKTVDISDYYISDSAVVPFKWKLTSKTLKSNESTVIYTNNSDDLDEDFYADFNLNSNTGYAILSKSDGKVIDSISYENLANGHAMVKTDNEFYETANISPGYANTSAGAEKYGVKYLKNNSGLMINEVMNNNSKYISQNGGEYYDWIELKNNSNSAINLSEYYISNDLDDKEMFKLPDINLKPKEYIVLIASEDTDLTNDDYYHLNFKLSNNDGVYLIKNSKITDTVFLYNIPANYSYGRNNSSGFFYISTPSPGSENSSGIREISYTPEASTLAGVFNDVDELNVKLKAPGKIYYTTDGSNPTTSSKLYSGGIKITKTTVIKAVNYESGKKVSEAATFSYIINENHTLPVLSISMNPSNFSKVSKDPWNEDLEVSAYAELYEADSSFSIPCGFKLFGGATRGLAKQSFSLKFKKQYGETELKYKVFDNRNYTNFNTLIVRSGSQDYKSTMIRDELGTSIVDGVTNLDVQAYKAVILYINGKYWGVYFLREKVDEEFVSNHYNVSPVKTNIIRVDNDITYGTSADYNKLLNYVRNNSLSKAANYNYVKERVDIDSLIDFWIAEVWTTNNDIVNQRYFSNPNVENGKWNYIFYDLDYAFYNESINYFNFMTDPDGVGNPVKYNNTLIRALMKSKEFKERFVERLSYNLNNVWTKKRINDKMNILYNTILPEMPRNQERWGFTMNLWKEELDELKDYINDRNEYLLKQIKSYFSLSDSEMEKYFGDIDE